ncbi:TetR/AcrR family transcriptional regulator [bacterium SCSIO 12741]|nr:TetR/AcrR family transcriptional regulator [bacterium SCSIO 12741]
MPRSKEAFEEIRLATRSRILEQSMKLFADYGFKHTSINRIADACGIAKGTVYHHFKTKEDILLAIIQNYVEQMIDGINQIPVTHGAAQILHERVKNIIRMVKENPEVHRLFTAVIQQIHNHPAVIPYLEKMKEVMLVDYIDLFRQMNFEDPEMELMYFDAVLDGAIFKFLLLGEEYPLDQVIAELMKRY